MLFSRLMNVPRFSMRLALIVAMLGMGLGAAPAARADSPAGRTLTPLQQQYLTEKGRLTKLNRLAWTANPMLREAEDQTAALKNELTKKQQASREAIDNYLKEKGLGQKELAAYKLDQITALMMRIMPYKVVANPKLKEIVTQAIKRSKPVHPAEFANQFARKKPSEVPGAELLAFYQTQLKRDAEESLPKLNALIKDAQTPQFMVEAMQDLTYLKCVLNTYRSYLDGWTPVELKQQRLKVARLEVQMSGGGSK